MPFHKFVRDADGWKTLGEEIAFANPYVEVSRVTVSTPTRKEFELGPFNSIGRHPDNTIQILDRIISKEHCQIVAAEMPDRASHHCCPRPASRCASMKK